MDKSISFRDVLTASLTRGLTVGIVVFCLVGAVRAEEQPAGKPYSGDFLSRSTLTGDWAGLRNDLSGKGVTFDLNLTQVEQGVVNGGLNSSWKYGGRGDLTVTVDTGKLGLWSGGFLTAELEGNFGHAINGFNGGLSPVNNNQMFPMAGKDQLNLPALNFTQFPSFLSGYFGLVAGKFDTTSGDNNEFAHGKGDTQFFNLAFNLNPALLLAVPYSTLGAGMIILPTRDPNAAIVNLTVLSTVGKADTSGFNDLDGNKLTFNGEARVRTGFFGLTGHQLVGLLYSNKTFNSLDERLLLVTHHINEKQGSYAVYTILTSTSLNPIKARAVVWASSADSRPRTATRIPCITCGAWGSAARVPFRGGPMTVSASGITT
jgi:porin